MFKALSLLFRQLQTIWKHFGINQKVSVFVALLVTVAVIGGILYTSSRPDYRLLVAGMTFEDAARAQEGLEEAQISVQLRDHGQSIYVPAADVYRGRLLLASSGKLPKDSSSGFELFEEPKFGLTEFAQQVNFQRALQGELERTIRSIDGIDNARVMLVMPKDRLFSSDKDNKGSASIMVTLRRGVYLDPDQVESITQLVGTAVPGLAGGNITVTDQQGRLLFDPARSGDQASGSPRRQRDLQQSIEQELTRKAQDMLDLSLGEGQSIVRVNAEIDFREVEKVNETYDAEGRVVVRETINSENSSEPVALAGTGFSRVSVDSPDNVNVEQPMGQVKKEEIDTEYRVPSGRETVIDRGGRVSRLSVSVSVASKEEPRTPEALQQIERMVGSAVGLNPQRQDSIEVIEMAFSTPAVITEKQIPWWQLLPIDPSAILRVAAGIGLLLFLYLFSRKTMRQLAVQREETGLPVSSYLEGSNSGAPNALPEENQSPYGIEYASRLAEQNPTAVASWIDHSVKGNV
jgi:flagellar M-ring protein FliF